MIAEVAFSSVRLCQPKTRVLTLNISLKLVACTLYTQMTSFQLSYKKRRKCNETLLCFVTFIRSFSQQQYKHIFIPLIFVVYDSIERNISLWMVFSGIIQKFRSLSTISIWLLNFCEFTDQQATEQNKKAHEKKEFMPTFTQKF